MLVRSYYILQCTGTAGKNKRQKKNHLFVMRLRNILFIYVDDILDPKHYFAVYQY